MIGRGKFKWISNVAYKYKIDKWNLRIGGIRIGIEIILKVQLSLQSKRISKLKSKEFEMNLMILYSFKKIIQFKCPVHASGPDFSNKN